jgi:tRNA (uracil-5-)-methyltransferase
MPSSVLIEGISTQLTGYGFVDGRKVDFSYSSIGDTLLFETLGRGKRKYHKVIEKKSMNLRNPGCEYFTQCGGCKARHLPYVDQFKYKAEHLYNYYLENYKIELELQPSLQTEEYRNRMDFAVFPQAIGLRQEGNFRKIVDVKECKIQSTQSNRELRAIREYLVPFAYNRKTGEGFLKYITLRFSMDGELTTILTFTSLFRETEFESKMIREFPEISYAKNIIFCYNRPQAEVSAVGEFLVVKGREFFQEKVMGKTLNVPFDSFFQPNLPGFKPILEFIQSSLQDSKNKRMLDLFCGSGFFSMLFGEFFEEIYGYDIVPSSIQKAIDRCNQEYPNKKVQFQVLDLLTLKENILFFEETKDTILFLDPPRNGLGTGLAKKIGEGRFSSIFYISCNPESQRYDLEVLKENFKISRGLITDPYPHTPHLESVLLLERKNDLFV